MLSHLPQTFLNVLLWTVLVSRLQMSAMMRLAFKIIVAEFFPIKKEDKVYIQIKSSQTH
jgi:hypothetical protein